jgi:hypothetical protein
VVAWPVEALLANMPKVDEGAVYDEKQRPPKAAASEAPRKTPKQVVEGPVEDTIIDVTEEPVPGAVDATEDETIQTANSTPAPATLS